MNMVPLSTWMKWQPGSERQQEQYLTGMAALKPSVQVPACPYYLELSLRSSSHAAAMAPRQSGLGWHAVQRQALG